MIEMTRAWWIDPCTIVHRTAHTPIHGLSVVMSDISWIRGSYSGVRSVRIDLRVISVCDRSEYFLTHNGPTRLRSECVGGTTVLRSPVSRFSHSTWSLA